MSEQLNSVARLLGNMYAHVQNGIDRGIEWGFKKMEQQGKVTPKKKPKGIAGNVAAFGRGFFSVLGEAGGAYFRTYGELKKKR